MQRPWKILIDLRGDLYLWHHAAYATEEAARRAAEKLAADPSASGYNAKRIGLRGPTTVGIEWVWKAEGVS